jgi:hypothetical protein
MYPAICQVNRHGIPRPKEIDAERPAMVFIARLVHGNQGGQGASGALNRLPTTPTAPSSLWQNVVLLSINFTAPAAKYPGKLPFR